MPTPSPKSTPVTAQFSKRGRARYMARPARLPDRLDRFEDLTDYDRIGLEDMSARAAREYGLTPPQDFGDVESWLQFLAQVERAQAGRPRNGAEDHARSLDSWISGMVGRYHDGPPGLLSDQADDTDADPHQPQPRPGISPEWGLATQANEFDIPAYTNRNLRAPRHQHLRHRGSQHQSRDIQSLSEAAFGDPAEDPLDFDALADAYLDQGDEMTAHRVRSLKTTPPSRPPSTPVTDRQQYSAYRAPAGGMVVRGLTYPGGKFIPGGRVDVKTSYDKYSAIHTPEKYRRSDGSLDMAQYARDKEGRVRRDEGQDQNETTTLSGEEAESHLNVPAPGGRGREIGKAVVDGRNAQRRREGHTRPRSGSNTRGRPADDHLMDLQKKGPVAKESRSRKPLLLYAKTPVGVELEGRASRSEDAARFIDDPKNGRRITGQEVHHDPQAKRIAHGTMKDADWLKDQAAQYQRGDGSYDYARVKEAKKPAPRPQPPTPPEPDGRQNGKGGRKPAQNPAPSQPYSKGGA